MISSNLETSSFCSLNSYHDVYGYKKLCQSSELKKLLLNLKIAKKKIILVFFEDFTVVLADEDAFAFGAAGFFLLLSRFF